MQHSDMQVSRVYRIRFETLEVNIPEVYGVAVAPFGEFAISDRMMAFYQASKLSKSYTSSFFA